MNNIVIEQAANGYIVRVFLSAAGDDTRASLGQDAVNVYADAPTALAAVTALLAPTVAPTPATTTPATDQSTVSTSGASA